MDPRAAIDALLETGPHAFTLARWALLEKIGSPLAVEGGKGSILDTLFVMYASEELLKTLRSCDFKEKALEGADKIPAEKVQDMLSAAMDKVQAALYMCPEPVSKKKASRRTDS